MQDNYYFIFINITTMTRELKNFEIYQKMLKDKKKGIKINFKYNEVNSSKLSTDKKFAEILKFIK